MKLNDFLTCVVLLAIGLTTAVPASAGILGLSFSQADFDLGPNSQPNSDWGFAELLWDGSGVQYLNVSVNGSWQIQNAPLFSDDGSSRNLSYNFSLGNTVGTDVSSLNYVADIGASPLFSGPTGTPVAAVVANSNVAIGGQGGFFGPVTNAAPWIGAPPTNPSPDPFIKTGIPNQESDIMACEPTAYSNSLRWLDDKYPQISIPENKKSTAALKTITGWTAENGTAQGSWEAKRDALKDYVTTRFLLPNDLAAVRAEMRAGQDVEVDGDGHVATVIGMTELINGQWQIVVGHDTDQGNTGGLKQQAFIYDPATSKITSAAAGFDVGEGIDGFVVECPVPEPSTLFLLGGWSVTLLSVLRRRP